MKPRRGDILFPVQGNQQKEMSPLRGSGIQMTDAFYRDIAALRLEFGENAFRKHRRQRARAVHGARELWPRPWRGACAAGGGRSQSYAPWCTFFGTFFVQPKKVHINKSFT